MTMQHLVISDHIFATDRISLLDERKGKHIYETRPFIKNAIQLMKTTPMKSLQSSLKVVNDWRCLTMYCKLYADLNAFFLANHERTIEDNVAAFMIHHIMTSKQYRTLAMGLTQSTPRKKKKKKALFDIEQLPIDTIIV